MDRRRRRVLLGAVAAVLIASRASRLEAASAVHTVTIDAFEFKPPLLTVKRGDTIRWRNDDPVPHTVTAKDVFDSGEISAGATWQYTAAARGRLAYICTFHPTMTGELVVE